jgi:hypothetical protein
MKRLFSVCVAGIVSLGCLSSTPVWSQQTDAHAGHNHGDHADHAHGGETLAFVLPEWKTMHFEDAAKAQQHLDMVTKLGCEVKQGKHAGHIDLSYRCPNWKSMEVKTHALAEQWLGWLKGSGFDVSHGHVDASYAEGKESVEFRLVKWKSVHGNGGEQEKQFVDTLTRIGVEVAAEKHGNHSDIRYRSPVWRDVHVADHAAAEQLMAWLKKSGFDVAEHKH